MRSSPLALVCVLTIGVAGCGGGGNTVIPAQNAGAGGAALATNAATTSQRSSRGIASSSGPYNALVSAGNPLAYYKLNDTTSTLTDSGPSGLNGAYGSSVTLGGAPLTSAGDRAALFAASAAGVSIPANSATVLANAQFTTPTNNLTVEAWIKPASFNATNDYEAIAAYGREVIGSAWAIQVTPQSALTFYLKTTTASYLLKPSTSLTPGQIFHVVATYTGSSANLYINGALASTLPATGTINYAGTRTQDGLAIGGAMGGSLPIFNGAINDVAIYTTALSAATLQQHYIAGLMQTPLVEKPASSDAFVDSIGVVTHLRTSGNLYANFPAFESLIVASGIRHIGDTLIQTPAFYPQEITALAAQGIHASLITSLNGTATDITSALPFFGNAVESVGGPNEPDVSGDANWIADTRASQQLLYATIKGNPATASLPVVGPSITTLAACTALGNLSAYMDAGSMHDYFGGYNPGTTGWGGLSSYGIYGSLAWNLAVNGIVSGSKPIMATETGYSNFAAQAGSIDNQTLARYVPRTYLEHFLHGVPRTTSYEFYDEPGSGNFANFGLVGAGNVPKPSYYAIQSLIKTLADPGAPFVPPSVRYYLTGNLNNVNHLLLQKRDGSYELVVWVETPSYNLSTLSDIAVAPQSITLQPATIPTTASIATIGNTGTITSAPLKFSGSATTFTIDDHVSIISFK